MRRHIKLNIAIFSAIIIVVSIFVVILRVTPRPDPPSRNVRILVGGGGMPHYTLLEVNENHLYVTVIWTAWTRCDETGEFSTGGREPFDHTLLNDFAESFAGPNLWSVLRRYDLPFSILNSESVELSEEQLHIIWQKIDNVVQNYEESQFIPVSPPIIRAIIDGELYWIAFVYSDTLQSRRDRRLIGVSDIDLAILTHYLVDLAPIQIWW